jgi:hypothetical protein
MLGILRIGKTMHKETAFIKLHVSAGNTGTDNVENINHEEHY